MSTRSRIQPMLEDATTVIASSVLLAALRMTDVPLADLVREMVRGHGRLTLGSDATSRRLARHLPRSTVISSRRNRIELGLPTDRDDGGSPYCEADGLPFVDLPPTSLPEAILDCLPGRPLSSLTVSKFEPLRQIDPMIESVGLISRLSGAVLAVTLDVDWLEISIFD